MHRLEHTPSSPLLSGVASRGRGVRVDQACLCVLSVDYFGLFFVHLFEFLEDEFVLEFFADALAIFGPFFPQELAGAVAASFFKLATREGVVFGDLCDDHLAVVDGGFFLDCVGKKAGLTGELGSPVSKERGWPRAAWRAC